MHRERAILQEMSARGFEKLPGQLRFRGKISTPVGDLDVEIDFDDPTMVHAPKLYLEKSQIENAAIIAHLESDNRLCYVAEELFARDISKPRELVARLLSQMESALQRSCSHFATDDISREFPQHWGSYTTFVDLPESFSGDARSFSFKVDDFPLSVIGKSEKSISRIDPRRTASSPVTATSVYVIRVDKPLTFQRGQKKPQTLGALIDWLDPVRPKLMKEIVRRCLDGKSVPAFLLSAPNGFAGFQIEFAVTEKALIDKRWNYVSTALGRSPATLAIKRFSGSRIDQEFVSRRNIGDQKDLSAKRIAVVGAGTIGGFFGRLACQAGAGLRGGSITFYDEQALRPGNVGRHFLPLRYVDQKKATALQRELSLQFPESRILGVPEDATKYIDQILASDLTIDCTGEVAFSDFLNEKHLSALCQGNRTTVLYSFLVGNGAAARTLIVDGREHQCYRCTRLEDGHDRFPILRADSLVSFTAANCGEGAFIPYALSAPVIASGMLLQAALDCANQRIGNRWRTIRLDYSSTQESRDSSPNRRPGCPACRDN